MSNRLITINEAVASLKAELDSMTPAQQEWEIYYLQTVLGGFPRDFKQESRLLAALEAE